MQKLTLSYGKLRVDLSGDAYDFYFEVLYDSRNGFLEEQSTEPSCKTGNLRST